MLCTLRVQTAVLLWMDDPATRDAVVVRECLLADDLRGTTEVLCSRTPSQIQTLKQIYHSKFGIHLLHDLEYNSSTDHQKVTISLILLKSNW